LNFSQKQSLKIWKKFQNLSQKNKKYCLIHQNILVSRLAYREFAKRRFGKNILI